MKIRSKIAKSARILILLCIVSALMAPPVISSAATTLPSSKAGGGVTWDAGRLSQEFPSLTSETRLYFVVGGVNTSSPLTRGAYEEAKERLNGSALVTESYYELDSRISKEALRIALTSLKNATNLTTEIYREMVYANRTFGRLLNKSLEEYPSFKALNATLPGLEEAYARAYSNITRAERQFEEIERVLNESDGEYLSIHRNLTEARTAVNNLTSAVESFDDHINALQRNYTVTMLRVIWSYRGLKNRAEAYELGAAYSCRVASLSLLLHLPEDFIYSVFYATLPAYREKGYPGITDELLANVTMGFVLKDMKDSPYPSFDREFGKEFISEVRAYDEKQGINTAIRDNTQNQLKVISQLVSEALNNLPPRLSSSHVTYHFPVLGNVSGNNMSFLLREVLSGRGPRRTAVDIAIAFGVGRVPRQYYLALLSEKSPTELEVELLSRAVSQELPDGLKKFSRNISTVIIGYEMREYSGVLSSNPEALRNATLEVLKLVIPGMTPKEYGALETGSPREALETLLSGMLQSRLTDSALSVPENLSKIAAEVITSRAPQDWGNLPSSDVISEILNRTFGEYGYRLAKKLYSGLPPRDAASSVFMAAVVPDLTARILQCAGPEASRTLRKALEGLPNRYPLSQKYLKEFSINVTCDVVSTWEPKILGRDVRIPTALIAETAWELRGNPNLITPSDVSEIAQRIHMAGLRANRDRILALKSPRNDSLVVIVKSAKGDSNTTTPARVRKVLESSFGEVSPSATVTMIAPLNLTATPKPASQSLRGTVPLLTLLGALILLMALGGPLLAALIPSIAVLLTLEAVSGALHGIKGSSPGFTAPVLIVASGSAFALSYYLVETFRRELALPQSSGRAGRLVGAVLLGTGVGAMAVFGTSFVLGFAAGLQAGEAVMAAVLLSLPVVLTAALLYVSLRILGDRLVFWWPMSGERVLRVGREGRLLMRSLAVFAALTLVSAAAFHFTTHQNSPGIALYGNSVYVVFQTENGVKEGDISEIRDIGGALASTPGIEGAYTLTSPYGVPLNLTLRELGETWASNYVSQNGTAVLLVLKVDGERTANVEKAIRDTLERALKSGPGVEGVSFEGGIAVVTLR